MNIEIRAQVLCTDGIAGLCTRVIVNPAALQVTHLVVQAIGSHTEHLVPRHNILSTDSQGIRLDLPLKELALKDELVERTFTQLEVPDYPKYVFAYVTGDQIPAETVTGLRSEEHIPPGELAVDSITRVEATDGYMGLVNELVVDPESGRITSLVMREGPPWAKKSVAILAAQIDRLEAGVTYLKLDKQGVEPLFAHKYTPHLV